MIRLRDLFRRSPDPVFDAALRPDEPLAVIGDVHGRDDLLARLLARLEDEAPDHRVVLVGDYIDRGDDSRLVLERLVSRTDVLCLQGNHESMCLGFLERPEANGPRWLRNGGLQTLASYGIGGVGIGADPARLLSARDALALAMGDATIGWLRALPNWWQSGNVVVTHAAADPDLPLAEQDRKVLLWGHPRFESQARADGLWIVRGHVIVEEPEARDGRISIDTGAYASGRLTAALIGAEGARFIQG